jgi:DNA invertase Pin-like site-specific DNA recombinase
MAAAWCQQHGYRLDDQLNLSDAGRSAYKGKHLSHGHLGRFLELAEAGQLGDSPLLIIEAIDRLSRQEPMRALQRVVFALVDAGVRIAALEDNRIYDRESLQGDALVMLVLRCKAAHEYSQRLSRRVRDSWAATKQAMRDGTESGRGPNGGKAPFWLDFDPTTRRWELNDRAEDVRLIFDELQHHGLTLVAQTLNARGSLSPGGKPWAHYSVRKVAIDPAVYGALRLGIYDHAEARAAHHRWLKAKADAAAKGQRFREPEPQVPDVELIPDHYPPAIDQAAFDRVAAALTRRGASKGTAGNRSTAAVHTFLQAGVALCQHGGTMGAHLSKKPGRDDIYYLRCRSRLGGKGCQCNGKGWRLDEIHPHVASRLNLHVLGQAVLPGLDHRVEQAQLQVRLTAAQQLLADANTQVDKAVAVMEQAVDGDAQLDLLQNLSALVEKRRITQRSAQAQVDALLADMRLLQARAKPETDLIDDKVSGLLQAIALGSETQAERERLHRVLVRTDLQVQLDDSNREQLRVGMRFGSAAAWQWQAWDPGLTRMVAHMGGTELQVAADGSARFEAAAEEVDESYMATD